MILGPQSVGVTRNVNSFVLGSNSIFRIDQPLFISSRTIKLMCCARSKAVKLDKPVCGKGKEPSNFPFIRVIRIRHNIVPHRSARAFLYTCCSWHSSTVHLEHDFDTDDRRRCHQCCNGFMMRGQEVVAVAPLLLWLCEV